MKQLEPLARGQPVLVAVRGDRQPVYVLHDEEGAPVAAGTGIEDPGCRWVIHQRESLALGCEPSDYLAAVHAALDQFERHLALHRLGLLGQPDFAHAAPSELALEPVVADRSSRLDLSQ